MGWGDSSRITALTDEWLMRGRFPIPALLLVLCASVLGSGLSSKKVASNPEAAPVPAQLPNARPTAPVAASAPAASSAPAAAPASAPASAATAASPPASAPRSDGAATSNSGPGLGTEPKDANSGTIPPERLWGLDEGVQDLQTLWLIQWRAEKRNEGVYLVRVANQDVQTARIPLEAETKIREKVARLSIQLPKRPIQIEKSRCPHWVDIETLYGRRYFCTGDDADQAFELLSELYRILPSSTIPRGARSN